MDSKKVVRRGEIYYCNFGSNEGSVQNGLRPVLVVQCDEGNRTSPTTVVAAITTVMKKQRLPSHVVLDPKYGLKHPSMVMLEQLKTVNQTDLINYVGFIEDEYIMRLVDNGLKKSLGVWKQKKKTADIRCLCETCLGKYKENPKYLVRRLEPFVREKKLCSKCQNYGYAYIIITKD